MKNFWQQCVIIVALLDARLVIGQGTFVNLDFESATLPVIPAGQTGGFVSIEDAIPGWTAYGALVSHNNISLGGAAITVYGPQWSMSEILEGSYSLGVTRNLVDPTALAAIGQTGEVPVGSNSILYYAKFGGGLAVSFAGISLSSVRLASTPSYDIYGADISGRGGQIGELRFTSTPGGIIDKIQFSSQVVPEPSTFALLVGGLVFLASAGVRGRKQG